MSGLHANDRRERISEDIAEYVRTEYRNENPEWLAADFVRRENGH